MNRLFQRLNAAELQPWLHLHPSALILDTRDATHYAAGHLPGSRRVDGPAELDHLLCQEDRLRPVLIYSENGDTSEVRAQVFADSGFGIVADLIGGWTAWRAFEAGHAPHSPPGRHSGRGLPVELADWLTSAGFDPERPDRPDRHGNTALMQAAWDGQTRIVSALLDVGAAADAVNGDGNNALWLACMHGDPALIELLVGRGVPIDQQNSAGATCLMYAAATGKSAVVALLLRLGADPDLRSQDGDTAFELAETPACRELLRVVTRPARHHAM